MASARVEDHLLVEWAKWHGASGLLISVPAGFVVSVHLEAQLEALAAVGLLSEREAAQWRERFADVDEPAPSVEVGSELRARVDRYLESLLPEERPGGDAAQLEAALGVLEELGALSEDDVHHWFDRIEGLDDILDDERDEEGQDLDDPEFKGRQLRAVLLGPDEEADGFRLTSLELYDDGVVARWNVLLDASPGDEAQWSSFSRLLETELVLSDDAGTDYAESGASASGGSPVSDSGARQRTRGEATFVPAVPPQARRLLVEREGHRLEVELER